MQQVLSARVPIIKFEMIDSGLAFDVSWEVRGSPWGNQGGRGGCTLAADGAHLGEGGGGAPWRLTRGVGVAVQGTL
jgi:hypothetical protein